MNTVRSNRLTVNDSTNPESYVAELAPWPQALTNQLHHDPGRDEITYLHFNHKYIIIS